MRFIFYYSLLLFLLIGCSQNQTSIDKIQLITLDPGHFHAALIQKSMYPEVDSLVYVYGPDTPDIKYHLGRIAQYNSSEIAPTHWKTKSYIDADFYEKWKEEHKGNVVMLSGNNLKKMEYITTAIQQGYHVYADKPMAINMDNFTALEKTFSLAEQKKLLLYDIMTERYEITTRLQKELSEIYDVFGNLIIGSVQEPAITKESVHHYFKNVSGKPLVRPTWFFDTQQQGEGLVDVSVHLVDLTFWECFPEQAIDKSDIALIKSERWPTYLSEAEFEKVTGSKEIPEFLLNNFAGDSLAIYANGALHFTLKGHHAKVSVLWNYQAPEGGSDTHYSIMRGTKSNLIIVQDKAHQYTPTLYIEPQIDIDPLVIQKAVIDLEDRYPGVSLTATNSGWRVEIPKELREGHEAHFAAVTKKFITYFQNKSIPEWERKNMITKYYLTTLALDKAQNR